ncbi:hypothetical protein [Microbacterium sp. 5K110]|jgi:hypothetical protein|uniref:hypothetical protein n=1 Tax=Microbacterium sp. 5K110 TaxID=2578104 RepID=UPI0010FEC094|nr:hypothetical protein [Microbacterium sp. 5K110]TLF33211.1 hypothetical protein FE256_03705 [Microbacterium sp. 5K110]
MGSVKVTAGKLEETLARVPPVTLPTPAWGPQPIGWFTGTRPVWVWVSWRDRPATREPGVARGANDRVVMVSIDVGGDHWEPVVWRNAVTVRG